MQTIQIRETQVGYVVETYQDALPPRCVGEYPTLEAALASQPDVDWEEFRAADDGDAGDVLYVARIS